jgi:hypothetical protein
LGARTSQALGLIIGNALRLVLGGVALGLGLALALTRYLATLLYRARAEGGMSGRPFERGNKAGKGRPPGSRNKKGILLDMLQDRGEAILTKGIFMALSGDRVLQRVCIERLIHTRRRLARPLSPEGTSRTAMSPESTMPAADCPATLCTTRPRLPQQTESWPQTAFYEVEVPDVGHYRPRRVPRVWRGAP